MNKSSYFLLVDQTANYDDDDPFWGVIANAFWNAKKQRDDEIFETLCSDPGERPEPKTSEKKRKRSSKPTGAVSTDDATMVAVFDAIEHAGTIGVEAICDQYKLDGSAVKVAVKKLVESEKILREGHARGTKYRVNPNGPKQTELPLPETKAEETSAQPTAEPEPAKDPEPATEQTTEQEQTREPTGWRAKKKRALEAAEKAAASEQTTSD